MIFLCDVAKSRIAAAFLLLVMIMAINVSHYDQPGNVQSCATDRATAQLFKRHYNHLAENVDLFLWHGLLSPKITAIVFICAVAGVRNDLVADAYVTSLRS